MNHTHDYVNHFYEKFEGRVAIGEGYSQDLSEIYPFVFEDSAGALYHSDDILCNRAN